MLRLNGCSYQVAALTKERNELESVSKSHQAKIVQLTNQYERMRTLVTQSNNQLIESRDIAQRNEAEVTEKAQQIEQLKKQMIQLQYQYDLRSKPPTTKLLQQLNLKCHSILRIMIPGINQVWCCLSTSVASSSPAESKGKLEMGELFELSGFAFY